MLSHRGEFNIYMCINKIELFYDWILKIKTFTYGRFFLDARVILCTKRNTEINGEGAIVNFLIQDRERKGLPYQKQLKYGEKLTPQISLGKVEFLDLKTQKTVYT